MKLRLKTKRSGGVRVTAAVHRDISRGNQARDARDWVAAVASYRAALAGDPALAHIWIQLGHALKEADEPRESEAAYAEAMRIRPGDTDARLHRASLISHDGRTPDGIREILAAAREEGIDGNAARTLARLIGDAQSLTDTSALIALAEFIAEDDQVAGRDPAALAAEAARAIDAVVAALGAAGEGAEAAATLGRARDSLIGATSAPSAARQDDDATVTVYDLSDLIEYFRHRRLPTGIQRVQIEVAAHALRARGSERVKLCTVVLGRSGWSEIHPLRFLQVAQLAGLSEDRDDSRWGAALGGLRLALMLADPFRFPQAAVLVNLGTSWSFPDYLLSLRNAKASAGIRYVPFVHDVIPVMVPENCVRPVTVLYLEWLSGIFDHADLFLTNSRSTKADLIRAGGRLGRTLDESQVVVVPLDADFRRVASPSRAVGALRRWQLEDEPFALFVSTIESRKNHVLALDAWAELLRRHGHVPKLVCVGKSGWLNEPFFERLEANPELKRHVVLLSRVSDDELALLYGRCLFAVYTSLYEGWGLPVTEALCYGKVTVTADNSSLREAGGEFARYFESNSVRELRGALEEMIFDERARAEREARIAARFRPRAWGQIADQIDGEARRLAVPGAGTPPPAPIALPGSYYPLAQVERDRIWRGAGTAEIFRIGEGWGRPDGNGCRTREGGGALRVGVPGPDQPLRVYFRLRGLDDLACPYRIDIDGRTIAAGRLGPNELRWCWGVLPADRRVELRVVIEGFASMPGEPPGSRVSVGVDGFFLCGAGDEATRLGFIESAVAGALGDLDAYREKME